MNAPNIRSLFKFSLYAHIHTYNYIHTSRDNVFPFKKSSFSILSLCNFRFISKIYQIPLIYWFLLESCGFHNKFLLLYQLCSLYEFICSSVNCNLLLDGLLLIARYAVMVHCNVQFLLPICKPRFRRIWKTEILFQSLNSSLIPISACGLEHLSSSSSFKKASESDIVHDKMINKIKIIILKNNQNNLINLYIYEKVLSKSLQI